MAVNEAGGPLNVTAAGGAEAIGDRVAASLMGTSPALT